MRGTAGSLLHPRYGDIAPVSTPEQCFCIFAMLVGAGYYAYVVGTMCSLVQGLDATNLAFQEQMDAMNTYGDYIHLLCLLHL